mgnify:CR=1 FL=1
MPTEMATAMPCIYLYIYISMVFLREMPYGRAKNPEVVERVQRGQILAQPAACPNQVYEVSSQTYVSND